MEPFLKVFETFREFFTGLAGLFVFWPDGRMLLRRTVAWCQTHKLREAWIAFLVVVTASLWALNSVMFAISSDLAALKAHDVSEPAAVRAPQPTWGARSAGTWEKLKSSRQVMFDPGFLLTLSPKQQALTSLLQALAMATLGTAMMGVFSRLLPRVRSQKKQAQVWTLSVAALPLVELPLLFGCFGVVVLYDVPELALVSLGLGVVASMALMIWLFEITQRAFKLTRKRYWLLTTAGCGLILGFSFLGAFSVKPYADVAKAFLGTASVSKEK